MLCCSQLRILRHGPAAIFFAPPWLDVEWLDVEFAVAPKESSPVELVDGRLCLTGGIPDEVLATEAALAAMGAGAFELYDYVDFGPWLEGTVLPVTINPPPLFLCHHCPYS